MQHVKPAIQMLDEGESLLSGDNMLKGQLRIGASDTICRYYLIHYLQKFHQEFPDVRIKVTNLLMDLARIGLGIACIPDYMLNPDDSLKPIPLADPLPPRQLVLVQHDSLPLSQAAERFLDMFS